MNHNQEYQRWMAQPSLDSILRNELEHIAADEKEIADRFYKHLTFGTGGLRGMLGAGTNRMNYYTVGRATHGLASYLKVQTLSPVICIAYDTRNMSAEFALHAALVLATQGVTAYLWETVHPTPMLSYAVRHRKADAGIVITASHNPKEYNGYKVYGPDGGQITDEVADAILDQISRVDVLLGVPTITEAEARSAGLLRTMPQEVDDTYFEQVLSLVLRKDLVAKEAAALKILYSPLHGSGNIPVRRILKELGFSQVEVVPQQELPDGNFPTTPYPNPEEPAVFELAIQLAQKTNPDLIFATDPDCDRIGVLVKDDAGQYTVLSGNQVGALLCDYILTTHRGRGTLPDNAAIVKTIVTTDLADRICAAHGAAVINTLTGFKYIGEAVGEWEQNGKHSFLFGFEESYGYLAGTFVRDKDAVMAAALIAELALWHKSQGCSLYDAVQEMYRTYGYTAEKLISVTMPGESGQKQIAAILEGLRQDYKHSFPQEAPETVEDYLNQVRTLADGTTEPLTLPRSNVLKFLFNDSSWLVLRPSGTEPKIKTYLYAIGNSKASTQKRLAELETIASSILKG